MLLSLVLSKRIGKKKLQWETLCFFCNFNPLFAQVHFLIICIKIRLIGVNLSLKGETFSRREHFLLVEIVLSTEYRKLPAMMGLFHHLILTSV